MPTENKYHPGETVKVSNRKHATYGMTGVVCTHNDSKDMDYKLDFGDSWQGYYNEEDLSYPNIKKVFKYKILPPLTSLDFPVGSRVLAAHSQGDDICIWVETSDVQETKKRTFVPIPTGMPFEGDMDFIGTVFLHDLVFHIYERIE